MILAGADLGFTMGKLGEKVGKEHLEGSRGFCTLPNIPEGV